jgi:hypothetical protein
MYKKIFLIIWVLVSFVSCKKTDNPQSNVDKKQPKDSTIVGADQDENGCLASAGYTWSKLNKECVKAFTGIQLNPVNNASTEDVTLCAFVLFNESGDKAEVFLPDEKSIILSKTAPKTWAFQDYQLIQSNGFSLLKAGVKVYTGDAEMGSKVTGSDNPGEEGQE